jgi:hypothetical protein
MATREPSLRSPAEVLRRVFDFHGPRRYEDPSNPFNGAVTLIQPSDAFAEACAAGVGAKSLAHIHGQGAVWAWFVGSPRAFLFGFSRSERYAVRKMQAGLRSEFEAVTGQQAK